MAKNDQRSSTASQESVNDQTPSRGALAPGKASDSALVPTYRMPYGPRLRSSVVFAGPGRTKQAHGPECDINIIMRQFDRTGVLDPRLVRHGYYGEVQVNDYFTAMLQVTSAREAFAELPAELRLRFDNDPGVLLAFLGDEKNREEAVKLGLVNPSKEGKGVVATPPSPTLPEAANATIPPAKAGG